MLADQVKENEKNLVALERSVEIEHETLEAMKNQLGMLMKSGKEKEKVTAQLREENTSLRQRFNWLDNLSREGNLRFVGLPEQPVKHPRCAK